MTVAKGVAQDVFNLNTWKTRDVPVAKAVATTSDTALITVAHKPEETCKWGA